VCHRNLSDNWASPAIRSERPRLGLVGSPRETFFRRTGGSDDFCPDHAIVSRGFRAVHLLSTLVRATTGRRKSLRPLDPPINVSSVGQRNLAAHLILLLRTRAAAGRFYRVRTKNRSVFFSPPPFLSPVSRLFYSLKSRAGSPAWSLPDDSVGLHAPLRFSRESNSLGAHQAFPRRGRFNEMPKSRTNGHIADKAWGPLIPPPSLCDHWPTSVRSLGRARVGAPRTGVANPASRGSEAHATVHRKLSPRCHAD